MLKKICIADIYNNRYNVYENLQNIFEIIYFENCHTIQPDNNSDDIIKLLNTIQNDVNISSNCSENIIFCLKSDVKANNRYILLETVTQGNEIDLKINTKELVKLFDNITLDVIVKSINSKGFFYKNGKWLILLMNRYNDNPDAFLFVPFKDTTSLEDQYYLVRELIKDYRCKLTKCIEEGINTGSLYSNIKRHIAQSILSSDKTQSHGKSQDMVNLYILVKDLFCNINSESSEKERIRAYTAINTLMNRIISAGAIKNTYETYFDINYTSDPICNSMQKVDQTDNCFQQLKAYLDYISIPNNKYIQRLYMTYAMKNGVSNGNCIIKVDYEELQERILYVPQLLSKLENTCHEDSAIWLIGILDVFVRNAIRHSPKCENSNIEIKANQQIVAALPISNKRKRKYVRNYSFTIKNKINPILQEIGELHLTNQFFMDYLPKRSLESDRNCFCNNDGKTSDMYVLNVFFQYVCDEMEGTI